MIAIDQWRRAIGVFTGRRSTLSAQLDTAPEDFYSSDSDTWIIFNRRLFVCAIVLWGAVAIATYQPHVNTLLLCNDVETNPGPTMEEQMATLTNMMDTQFKDLKVDMAKMSSTLQDLYSALDDIRANVRNLKDNFSELEKRHDTLQLDIDATHEANCALQDRVIVLEDHVEKQERYSRRENVILHGLKEDSNEDYEVTRKKVTDLFSRTVKDKLWSVNDVLRAHRLGKPNRGKPRPVIVRFQHFMDKLTVLKAREELKKISIGLSNDLTMNQRDELAKLRANGQHGYYKNGRLVIDPPPSAAQTNQQERPFITASRHRNGTRP